MNKDALDALFNQRKMYQKALSSAREEVKYWKGQHSIAKGEALDWELLYLKEKNKSGYQKLLSAVKNRFG